MPELSEKGLKNRDEWLKRGYTLPAYDRAAMREMTCRAPAWIHIGAGNIFRAFLCAAAERMLNAGLVQEGIIAVEGYDGEIVEKGFRPYDDYTVLMTLKADGTAEKTVLGSIAGSLILGGDGEDTSRLKALFSYPGLQLVSFTITEKGYNITDAVRADVLRGPGHACTCMGYVAELLWARYRAGGAPLALVSMDNCSRNGDRLREAILTFARGWGDTGFMQYLDTRVSFPWTMIDKITPRPDPAVHELLEADGLTGTEPFETALHTHMALFVNAEESGYLVVEDNFPNGRPPLEQAGVIMTDRETVSRAERMKVCTCLNPLHTALAVTGCLLSYTRISDEMKDPDLVRLIRRIGYTEGLPVVENPGVIDPVEFLDTVVNLRLPNPFMPDTPQRIACDTSQKIPVRFGETLKRYCADARRDVDSLTAIPLALAAWLRYLTGMDDTLRPIRISPDPLLPRLQAQLAGIVPGKPETLGSQADALLADPEIFGVDLVEAGLAGKVKAFFREMLSGPGAVRAVLQKYI